MGMGILETGGSIKSQALAGMQKAARLGLERENAGRQLKAMEKQTKMGMAGSGMAAGAMAGTAIMPGVGTAIGMVVGGVAGYFGADLF
jgi:hypothetical protein